MAACLLYPDGRPTAPNQAGQTLVCRMVEYPASAEFGPTT